MNSKLFGFSKNPKVYIGNNQINTLLSKKVMFMNKKAQLGFIEMKFLLIGLVIGIILTLAVIFLSNKTAVLPAMFGFLCK